MSSERRMLTIMELRERLEEAEELLEEWFDTDECVAADFEDRVAAFLGVELTDDEKLLLEDFTT